MDLKNRIIYTVADGIATIMINRQQFHNALGIEEVELLSEYFQQVEQNNAIRVLVLTGAGQQTFCAGALLSHLQDGQLSSEIFEDMVCQLAALSIPTIALFNGSAYGGGSELALACDYRFGVEGMRVKVPPAEIGIVYPPRGIARFVNHLGIGVAKRLLMSAETVHDQQLLAMGYLTGLMPADEVSKAAYALAEKLASLAPLAVQGMKKVVDQCGNSQLDEQAAKLLADQCNTSDDAREGLAAKLEKRPAVFRGC